MNSEQFGIMKRMLAYVVVQETGDFVFVYISCYSSESGSFVYKKICFIVLGVSNAFRLECICSSIELVRALWQLIFWSFTIKLIY